MLAVQSNIMQGPYRATKLWNEAVRLFRTGMPVKKHRYLLKVYSDTFTGAEAVEWLHALLKANPNFGSHVTQEQTFQLLKKFLQNHVIEDVNGRWGTEKFSDRNTLYKFPLTFSPSKIIKQPLACLSNNQQPLNQVYKVKRLSSDMKSQKVTVSSPNNVVENKDNIWKNCLISSLLHTLHYDVKDKSLDWIHGDLIKCNLTTIHKLSEGHEMPFWVLSAMKCLASWPNSDDPDLPCYPGFEQDVFAAVCGYFQSLNEPLLSFKLYKLFISVFVRCEMLDKVCSGGCNKHGTKLSDSALRAKLDTQNKVDKQQDAVERIERQLHQARLRHANRAVRRTRSGKSRKLDFMNGLPNSALHGRPGSYKSLPRHSKQVASSFGWDLNETATRETWMERFQSMHALDALSEEHQRFDNLQGQQCNSFSLPDLLDCNKHIPMLSGINECSQTPDKLDDEIVAGAGYQLHEGQKLMCASVENLLLNMSNDMRDEMIDDLMSSRCASNENFNENVYESIKTLSRNENSKSDVNSPLYRTMKPCSIQEPTTHANVESPYMLMQKQSAIARHAALRQSQPALHQLHEDVCVKRNSLYTANNDNVSSYRENYSSLPRQRRSNPAVKQNRLSLKPSQDDLEHQLMQSISEGATANINYSYLGKRENLKSGMKTIPSSSSIVARFEVPPDCSTQPDPHKVKSRIMRLPYVSNEMSMANLHSSNSPSKQDHRFIRLSRSHSSLSHRKPRMNELKLSSRHGSMHVLNTRCGQKHYQDPVAVQKRLKSYPYPLKHSSAESQVDPIMETKLTTNEPQSPLSAAFITAKKKLSQDAARCNHVCEALQLCCVLLPAENRSRISLLLRLMSKIAANPHLVDLNDDLGTRNYLLNRFTPCFLTPEEEGSSNEEEKQTAASIVEVMMDNSSSILQLPTNVKEDATQKENEQKAKMKSRKMKPLQRQMTFCKQERRDDAQKKAFLQDSLTELLFDIINNHNLTSKEKKKKIKQFAKCYPEIYYAHFPIEEIKVVPQPRKKNPLSNAMQKLRGLRM